MVGHKKYKNFKQKKKKNNLLRFSVISFFMIFSFFTLPTVNNFLDKNLKFKKSIISNAGINFDQELEKRKKILDGESETKTKNLSLKNIFADIDFFSTDDEGQNSIRFDARTIELIRRYFPNIIKDPREIWAIATKDKEKTGNGTSLAITNSKFAEKRKTFAIPGSKK